MHDEFSKDYWEDRHVGGTWLGADRPNPYLAAKVAGVTPGAALDAGCGQGADALWLAAAGWEVTAVDITENALRFAQARSAGMPNRVSWVQADLASWVPGRTFDLVYAHYVHPLPPLSQLASWVSPGGTLLIVGHHPSDEHVRAHTNSHDAQFTEDQAASLDASVWQYTFENVSRVISAPDGQEISLHDTVLRAQRQE